MRVRVTGFASQSEHSMRIYGLWFLCSLIWPEEGQRDMERYIDKRGRELEGLEDTLQEPG